MRHSFSNKRKHLNCQRIQETNVSKSNIVKEPLKATISTESCEDCIWPICVADKKYQPELSYNHPHHILQEQNHGYELYGCECSNKRSNNDPAKSKVATQDDVGSTKDTVGIADSSAQAKCHSRRSDSLKENTPDAQDKCIPTLDSKFRRSDALDVVESTSGDQNIDPDSSDDNAYQRSATEFVSTQNCKCDGKDHEYFYEDDESNGSCKLSQLKAIEVSIEQHNTRNMLSFLEDQISTNKSASEERNDVKELYVSLNEIFGFLYHCRNLYLK